MKVTTRRTRVTAAWALGTVAGVALLAGCASAATAGTDAAHAAKSAKPSAAPVAPTASASAAPTTPSCATPVPIASATASASPVAVPTSETQPRRLPSRFPAPRRPPRLRPALAGAPRPRRRLFRRRRPARPARPRRSRRQRRPRPRRAHPFRLSHRLGLAVADGTGVTVARAPRGAPGRPRRFLLLSEGRAARSIIGCTYRRYLTVSTPNLWFACLCGPQLAVIRRDLRSRRQHAPLVPLWLRSIPTPRTAPAVCAPTWPNGTAGPAGPAMCERGGDCAGGGCGAGWSGRGRLVGVRGVRETGGAPRSVRDKLLVVFSGRGGSPTRRPGSRSR